MAESTNTNNYAGSGAASTNRSSSGSLSGSKVPKHTQDSGKTVLIGLLGGVASAVAFTIYERLPEAQRDRVHEYVRSMVASRLNDFRDGLNL